MHKVTFYPVGNGDSSQIKLQDGRRFMFDYRQHSSVGQKGAKPIDLAAQLRKELKEDGKDYFDVLALTHGDTDHIEGSTDFFELEHAAKYQGGNRIKAKELWVPAAMILEQFEQGSDPHEAKVWRQEARHRLIQGKGIRVFSKPDKLKDWLAKHGIKLEDRKHLITDAGQTVPGYNLQSDGVEFFCHSPFIKHCDGGDILRNESSLIFQIRFMVSGMIANYFAVGDSEYEVLEDIVKISEQHGRGDRLDWDLFNIPHHCSYKALGPEKGDSETKPTDPVARLLSHGQAGAYIISSSWPIEGGPDAYDQTQPPHVQAKNAYKSHLKKVSGREFLVTMEEPSVSEPGPLVFEIMHGGVRLSRAAVGSAFLTSVVPPRAGYKPPRAG